MIVPEFWAEARIQKRFPDRQITVRRFGWSDTSQDDAQRHADERVQEAFAQIVSGQELPRREQKVRYNGADGLPIREEIVERIGDSVVTRNSYGAKCLNTPDVFFADIDFPSSEVSCSLAVGSLFLAFLAAAVTALWTASFFFGVIGFVVVLVGVPILVQYLKRVVMRVRGGRERVAMNRIDAFSASHLDWHLRVYRTPNGFRILAMHDTFDPRSEEVEKVFRVLGVDSVYRLMCQKQNCFRARLTAKPWRIGIGQHLKPRPGVWPIKESRMEERRTWIEEYDSSAANYSACEFVKAIGAVHRVSSAAQAVCDVHDRVCSAHDGLAIA